MNLLKRTTALLIITLVLGAAGCSKSNDAAITTRVKHAISKEPGLRGTTVDVATDQKVVHLSGTVKSRDERATLIAVARKVEGVKAVKTDLAVAPQQDAAVKRQQTSGAKPQRTAVKARAKQEPRAQLRSTPPAPWVPPER
jgi:Tfp pilus assembly protein PilN